MENSSNISRNNNFETDQVWARDPTTTWLVAGDDDGEEDNGYYWNAGHEEEYFCDSCAVRLQRSEISISEEDENESGYYCNNCRNSGLDFYIDPGPHRFLDLEVAPWAPPSATMRATTASARARRTTSTSQRNVQPLQQQRSQRPPGPLLQSSLLRPPIVPVQQQPPIQLQQQPIQQQINTTDNNNNPPPQDNTLPPPPPIISITSFSSPSSSNTANKPLSSSIPLPTTQPTSSCPICMEPLTQHICALAKCGHILHHTCINQMINASIQGNNMIRCPCCREPIYEGDIIDLVGYYSGGMIQSDSLSEWPGLKHPLPVNDHKEENRTLTQKVNRLEEALDHYHTMFETSQEHYRKNTAKITEDLHATKRSLESLRISYDKDLHKWTKDTNQLKKTNETLTNENIKLRHEVREYKVVEIKSGMSSYLENLDYDKTFKPYENSQDPILLKQIIDTLHKSNMTLKQHVKDAHIKSQQDLEKARLATQAVVLEFKEQEKKLIKELTEERHHYLYEKQQAEKKILATTTTTITSSRTNHDNPPINHHNTKRIRQEVITLSNTINPPPPPPANQLPLQQPPPKSLLTINMQSHPKNIINAEEMNVAKINFRATQFAQLSQGKGKIESYLTKKKR
jgi:hypothetical protein